MGLELVELVLAVEEEFDVRLRCPVPETVGEFFDSIRTAIQRDQRILAACCPSIPVFFEVRDAVQDAWAASSRIAPSTFLIEVLPPGRLAVAWQRLESQLNVRLPKLTAPREQGAVALAFIGFVALMECLACVSADLPGLLFATVIGISVLFFMFVAIVNRLPHSLPNEISTVGDLVRNLLPVRGVSDAQSESLHWARFVTLVSDQLDVPQNSIDRASHFVRDLRCD